MTRLPLHDVSMQSPDAVTMVECVRAAYHDDYDPSLEQVVMRESHVDGSVWMLLGIGVFFVVAALLSIGLTVSREPLHLWEFLPFLVAVAWTSIFFLPQVAIFFVILLWGNRMDGDVVGYEPMNDERGDCVCHAVLVMVGDHDGRRVLRCCRDGFDRRFVLGSHIKVRMWRTHVVLSRDGSKVDT